MMDRMTDVALRISLLLASVGSLFSLAKMMFEHFVPMRYYWWSAVAFFGATAVLAMAIRLRDDRASTPRVRKSGAMPADPG